MSKLTSRKFWLAIIAALVAFGNGFYGWGLTVDQVALVVLPILAYIFGEAWVDARGA